MGDFTNCLSAFVLYGALGLGTIDESPAADLGMPRCRGFRSLWEAKQADREGRIERNLAYDVCWVL